MERDEPQALWRVTARVVLIFAAATLATCLLTPLVRWIAALVGAEPSGDRIWTRLGQAMLLAAFLIPAKRAGVLSARQTGLYAPGEWQRWLWRGLILALVCVATLFSWQHYCGWVEFYADASISNNARRIWTYVLSAVLVAILEEWFFRGVLVTLFAKWRSATFGIIAANLVFSSLHFVKAPRGLEQIPNSFVAGFGSGRRMLYGFEQPDAYLTAFGYFLFGVSLSLMRRATGSLWASIGVHAGLVYVVRLDGHFTHWLGTVPTIWTGGEHYVAGLPGWGLLALLTLLIAGLARRRSASAERSGPAPAGERHVERG